MRGWEPVRIITSRGRDRDGMANLSLPRLEELRRRGMISVEVCYGQEGLRTRIVLGRHGGSKLRSLR